MEKKELLEKTTEIKESAVKLFKQVDSYLGFNGWVAVIFGLTVITMLSMILDHVNDREQFRSDRNDMRQMRDGDFDDQFYQRSQRRNQIFGDDFDQAFQQMDQMRGQMRNQMQAMMQDDQFGQRYNQTQPSDSFFGSMKRRVQSWFGGDQNSQQIETPQIQTKVELAPGLNSQKISVANGSRQYTVNDENGQVSGTITLAKESLSKVDEAIKSLGLTTTTKDTTISFSGKLEDLNTLLQILESN